MDIRIMHRVLFAAVAALACSLPAAAHDVQRGDLTLSRLHLRASIGAVNSTAGYVTVTNAGAQADRLVSASCACARRVDLHDTAQQSGMARMTAAPELDVPARGALTLRPGGAHLMLTGLRRPLRDGERVPVTLRFQRAGTVTADFHVMARPGGADPAPAPNPHAYH